MTLTANDLKFLKRRKYNEASSQKTTFKLEFNLENKKLSEAKEDHFSLYVSVQNAQLDSEKNSDRHEKDCEVSFMP